MAASSSALAWPTGEGSGAGRGLADRGGDGGAFHSGARKNQGQRGVVVPADRIEPRVDRRRGRMFARGLRRRNRHRRAGVRRAAGARDARLDIERVEAAGILQRVKARIAHPLQKRGIGIDQPVEPVDQHAHGQQIEQRPVAPGFAARRRLRLREPGGFFARPWRFRRGRRLADRVGRVGGDRRRGDAGFAFEPRRQLPGEFVEGAVFHRRQDGRFRLAERPERQDVLGRFHGRFQIGWW